MAKTKKEKPMLSLDGKEYALEDMTQEQKQLANDVALYQNHIKDVQNKLANNAFVRQQLVECEKVFLTKHQNGVLELKQLLETSEKN